MGEKFHAEGRSYNNIALIGFMGVGKSTCGKLLARKLDFQFFDTDTMISEETGCSIPEIFRYHGEERFRQMERRVVQEKIPLMNRCVIATGGGLGANLEYLESLKRNCFVVHLWLSPEGIYDRVKRHKGRPLLETADPMARIRELFEKRISVYRHADAEVSTLNRPVKRIVFQIMLSYQSLKRKTNEFGIIETPRENQGTSC